MSPTLKLDTGADLAARAQIFKRLHDVGEIADPVRPVQEIKVELIGPEPLETRRTGARDAVAGHVGLPHFGDQEHAIALAGDDAAD
jgi:hypothetical protein